jgi:cobalt-precorrin-5B (C1)-methyltransferase
MARRRRLKTGFSTGTAAAAATKAALIYLLSGQTPDTVQVDLPGGGQLEIAIARIESEDGGRVRATVVKDAGDDPDVTHRAEIQAVVEPLRATEPEDIVIKGGQGVGVVTLPGLPVQVGEPAINPVPRQMIETAVRQVWIANGGQGKPAVTVEIVVPEGERLAAKTLNPRLGIVGGISILGTTGLVRPLSHEAYTATIDSALDVARALGIDEVVLTTGGRSEKAAQALRADLPPQAFVQMADFFGYALGRAAEAGFKKVGLVSFFGKAVKQAQAVEHTHAHRAALELGRLAGWLDAAGAEADLTGAIAGANTARQALDVLRDRGRLDLVAEVGRRMLEAMAGFTGKRPAVWAVVVDYDASVLFREERSGQ